MHLKGKLSGKFVFLNAYIRKEGRPKNFRINKLNKEIKGNQIEGKLEEGNNKDKSAHQWNEKQI